MPLYLYQEERISNYLVASGFNFSVPSGAAIKASEVDIEKSDGDISYSADIRDNSVKILKAGSVSAPNML